MKINTLTKSLLLFSVLSQSSLFAADIGNAFAMVRMGSKMKAPETQETATNNHDLTQQTTPPKEAPASHRPEHFSSQFQFGGDYTRVHFHPVGHTSFNGNLGGAQGLYEYKPIDCFYMGAKLAWKEGDTHASTGKRSLLYIDAQERIGYTFGIHRNDWLLTLFTGLGYRHLGQKFSPKEGDSIKFRYNELYVPVGALVDYAFNTCFHWGLNFIWMPQAFPTVGIIPLKGANWDLTYKLANFLVELPFSFTFTKNNRWSLIFKPFYERWEDGHTTAKTAQGVRLGLPGNHYDFWGADVNFMYQF